MKLYFTHSSPFARQVRMLMIELGLDDQLEEVECHPFLQNDRLREINPLGKIPCLELEDKTVILDSGVIQYYLLKRENRVSNLALDVAHLLSEYQLISGAMDAAVFMRVNEIRKAPRDFFLDRQTETIQRVLNRFEHKIKNGQLIDEPIQFCALSSLLAYLDFRHEKLSWKADFPKLNSWFENTKARSSFQNTRYMG